MLSKRPPSPDQPSDDDADKKRAKKDAQDLQKLKRYSTEACSRRTFQFCEEDAPLADCLEKFKELLVTNILEEDQRKAKIKKQRIYKRKFNGVSLNLS
jgi:hypothetical protein